MENITELGKLWQEEIINLTDIPPENLDAFENRIQDVLHRLGKAMMEWKLKEWNSSINKDKSKDKCPKCNSKVHNRKRTKQILTTVATIDYERYMSSCPKCNHTQYPLDCALGIQPLQRMSSLAILCGASWDYGKSEYILGKLLRHDKLSHETIQEKTNAVGSSRS